MGYEVLDASDHGVADPVGTAAKNDLDQVARAGTFRAVVVDNTNTVKEIPVSHFSGTNPMSVRLYLQADTTKPLLVDKDKDGFCDDVAEVDGVHVDRHLAVAVGDLLGGDEQELAGLLEQAAELGQGLEADLRLAHPRAPFDPVIPKADAVLA